MYSPRATLRNSLSVIKTSPKPQSTFHWKRGSHIYRNPGTIPFGISVHVTNPIIAQDVITLVPRPLTMASQAGLLNSAYLFVWGRICETRLEY